MVSEAIARRSEWHATRAVLHQLTRELPNAAFFVVDENLRYLYADGLALPLAGVDGSALVGQQLRDAVDPALASVYEPLYRKVLGGGTFEVEQFSHGRVYSSRGMPLRDETGAIYAALVCSFDITERHSAEVRREERARVLLEADRQKDEFLCALSHELRNPLAAVSNGARVAMAQCGVDSPAQSALEMMQRQLKHMARLLDDLHDLARVRSGVFILNPKRVVLQDVIRQSIEASQSAIVRHEQTLEPHLPGEDLVLMADPDRLAQVFTNLLVNSCKYSAQGGHIDVYAQRVGIDAIVRVSDTGVGIPADDLSRIFEKFSQGKARATRAQDGFGLGLALVKEIVSLHGGEVRAESPGVGQGSVFTVCLPLARRSDY
jgi:signal transduction histidine kinase